MKTKRYLATVAGLIALAGFPTSASAQAAEPQYDLVIRHGKIVDGTGNPWFYGDVAVKGDRIVSVERTVVGTGKREIDAHGQVVAPGFFDGHVHSDGPLLVDGSAQSKIRQGVTTEILGESASMGPFQGKLQPQTVTVGQNQKAQIVRLGDYFALVERAGISDNVASYVGMDQVWECVMGPGQQFTRPSAANMKAMKELVAEAMQDGALGLSSQLMFWPLTPDLTNDMVELCGVVHQYGGLFMSHHHDEGAGIFPALKQVIEVAERADVPLDVIHLKIADQGTWGQMDMVVAMINDARRRGLNVQADVYPYTRGNNNLSSIVPPWAHEGGNAKMIERLKDPTLRERLKKDMQNGLPDWYNHYIAVGRDWSRMLINANNQYNGMTMDRVIAMKSAGKTPQPDPLDVLMDLLIEQHGSVATVYAHHCEEDMNLALKQPWCSIGSDGSALATEGPLAVGAHPRSFGTFPRVLGVYVRERALLSLEDAVRKMTSLGAIKVGIHDRGLLQAGLFADITVFNPDKVTDKATYEEPRQYPEGIPYVIVNGQVVIDQGNHTGARPGRALRHLVPKALITVPAVADAAYRN
jgi:N-acyl-D-amino-acid deacylase